MSPRDNEELLSGLDYFDDGASRRPQVNIDSKINDLNIMAAQGTKQVLYIKMDGESIPVLIKSIDIGPNGSISIDYVSADRRYTEEVLWPHVQKAITLQIDIIRKDNKGIRSKLRKLWGYLWKKR